MCICSNATFLIFAFFFLSYWPKLYTFHSCIYLVLLSFSFLVNFYFCLLQFYLPSLFSFILLHLISYVIHNIPRFYNLELSITLIHGHENKSNLKFFALGILFYNKIKEDTILYEG